MMYFCDAVPMVDAESYNWGHELEDGSFRFISRAHPERNYITINRTAKQILDLCDGSRNLSAIHAYLASHYIISDEHNLEDDLYETVLRLWRIGVLSWREGINPFDKYFNINKNKCCARYMAEDEVVELISNMDKKDTSFIYFSAYASKGIELNIPFAKASWLNQNRLYFELNENGHKLFLALACNEVLNSYDVIFLAIIDGDIPTADTLCEWLCLVRDLCKEPKLLGKAYSFFYFSHTTDENMVLTTPIKRIGILERENGDQDYCIYAYES